MAENDRKSSDDLIREAKRGLQTPDEGPHSGGRPPVPLPEPIPEVEPQPLEYRSRPTAETVEGSDASNWTQPEGPIEPRPQRTTRRRGSLVRWLLTALVFGGWFLFTTLDDASRDDGGEIVEAGDLDVMSLQVGDCFDDPEDLDEVVYDVVAVPCAGPHDNEVFAVQELGTSFGDQYPGDDALSEHTYEACIGTVFDSYVGTSYVDSSLEVFTFTPTEESWDEGDRGFVCALYRIDFAKLTGTARDSGL